MATSSKPNAVSGSRSIPARPPVHFASLDIGSPQLSGSAKPVETGWDLIGGGVDIWEKADQFHFVFKDIAGDFDIAVRVESFTPAHLYSKAGLMIRDGLAANVSSVIVDAKPDGGVEFMARLCGGCQTTYLGGAHITFPAYLILSRTGSTFTAAVSQTGPSSPTTIRSVSVPMSSDAVSGLAVTSHDTTHVATAVFDTGSR